MTKFVDVLLDIPAEDEVISLIYNGPSIKDGLGEGGYTKRFLLDRLAQLGDFETLKQKLEALDHRARETFEKRVQDLSVEATIKNTYEEITHAAAVFGQNPAPQKVLQIASAGHAPRCMHNQVIARRDGFIKKGQPWYVVATDTTFPGSQLEDVLIIEPPSRGDDPLVGFSPTLGSTLKSFLDFQVMQKHASFRQSPRPWTRPSNPI